MAGCRWKLLPDHVRTASMTVPGEGSGASVEHPIGCSSLWLAKGAAACKVSPISSPSPLSSFGSSEAAFLKLFSH